MSRFQDAVSGVITGIFVKGALESDPNDDFDLVFENFFMSNLEQSCNPSLLIKHKITHVLSVCQAKNAFEKGLEAAYSGIVMDERQKDMLSKWKKDWHDIAYERISIADKPKVNISSKFGKAIEFIDKTLKNPDHRLLLHCKAGVSRAGTIFLAFLMHRGMTLDQAFKYARSKRPIIRPNVGFANALLRYQEELYTGVESPDFRKALDL
jgi:protein-tyrosine phosphatase